jgi:hypothetical protein
MLFSFFIYAIQGSLYIPNIDWPFVKYVMWYIFSYSIACLFILLTESFAEQKIEF